LLKACKIIFCGILASLVFVALAQYAGAFSIQTGYYVGTGFPKSVTGVGFRPDFIIIKSDTTAGRAIWTSSAMPAGQSANFETAAQNFYGAVTSIDIDGFSIGTDVTVNTANVRYTWTAFGGSGSSDFKVGSYTGDGTDSRDLNIGIDQPDFVIVKRDGASLAVWNSSAVEAADSTHYFTTAVPAADRIQAFTSTGFQLGSNVEVNVAGDTYYYVAFKASAGSMKVGRYTGTGVGHSEGGIGFKPDFVFIRHATNVVPVFSTNVNYGDESKYFNAAANPRACISTLEADGFFVGSAANVNTNAVVYHYAAFTGVPAPSPTGSFKMVTGSYTGNGTSQSITGLGFSPSLLMIKSDSTGVAAFTHTSMGVNSTACFSTATGNFAEGVTALNSDGFSVGSSTVVNALGVVNRYTAFYGAPSSNFYVGAYTGNGQDNRSITGLGFEPDLVVVKSYGAGFGVFRTSSATDEYSSYFSATADTNTRIKALESDGFRIGTHAEVNTAATLYFFFAFKNTAGEFKVGEYDGDGESTRSITGLGFRPGMAWIKRREASAGILRNSTVMPAPEQSQYFTGAANALNRIKSLQSDGFQVGNANEANSTTASVYRYAAWKGTSKSVGFHVEPVSSEAGASIAPSVIVKVLDDLGNIDLSDNSTSVTLAIGTNPGGGTLSGTTVRTVSSGLATFAAISIDKTGSGYTLAASASGLTGAASNSFAITPSSPAALNFVTRITSTAAGALITPEVTVKDAQGNLVTTATNEVTVSIASNPGSSTLSGTAVKSAAAGIATFESLSLNKTGAGYTLQVSSSGLTSATSEAFDITNSSASKLVFSSQPQTSEAGALMTAPVVQVQDPYGNIVASDNTTTVTIAIQDNPSSGTLSGTLTRTATAGAASFTELSVDRMGSGYSLAASAPYLTGTVSSAFDVTTESTAPYVSAVSPSDEAKGVELDSKINIRFSKPMDRSTVENSFVLKAVKDYRGETIDTTLPAAFSWTSDSALEVTPGSALNNNYTYRSTISKEAKSKTGLNFAEDVSYSFSAVSSKTRTNVFLATDDKTKLTVPADALDQDFYARISMDPQTSPIYTNTSKITAASAKLSAEQGAPKTLVDNSLREFVLFDSLNRRITAGLSSEATVQIPYVDSNDDGIVDGTGIRASALRLSRLDETNGLWVLYPGSVVDAANKTVAASVNSLSTFSLVALTSDLSGVFVFPNPFKPASGHTQITFSSIATDCTIRIFTIKGELVRTITVSGGNGQYVWDVKNDAGENVMSGLYVYLVNSSTDSKTGKLVIIR